MHLPWDRLTLMGLLLGIPGLYYAARFGSGFARVLSRKFRRGKPYLKGSATDYFLFSMGCLAVGLVGTGLIAASALQGGGQPFGGPEQVGTVRVSAPEPNRVRLAIEMSTGHPGPPNVEVNLPGVRWALNGEFVRWRFGPAWLGFRPVHRLESALGSSLAGGPPDRDPDSRAPVAGAYPLWSLVYRRSKWVPGLEWEARRTPWMPAEKGLYKIFVSNAGYVLVAEPEPTPPRAGGSPGSVSSGAGRGSIPARSE